MATIALYAGKINQMPSLIGEVRKSVDNYSSELFSLKSKALNIRKTVCDLDDVIGMIQASTEIQEQKAESLEAFRRKTEEFAADAVRIDEDAAAVINQSKEDFYNKYNYLKPDAEKNFLEEWFDNAAEWCAEHWQEIAATAAIIVGAALAIAAVVATGGAALVPLLTSLLTAVGVSAGTAVTAATIISFTVAGIAVVSTVGSSALNIADTWGNFDNPVFNTLQSVLNWSSMISNGLYSIGMLYNSIKYKPGGSLNYTSKVGRESVENVSTTKPNQMHHYATNKSKTYTPQLDEIAKKYGLDLDDAWNKGWLPHQGRHPNAYHEYVLDSMKQFDDIAQGNKEIFLKLFDNLKSNVKSNPAMLYKDYWK